MGVVTTVYISARSGTLGVKTDITGRVEGVNEKGVKINGEWYNFSNFFKGDKEPPRGVAVAAELDEYKGRQYLNKLDVIGSALPSGGGNSPVSGGSYGRSADTNDRIARQVALKCAVEFSGGSGEPSDVIADARVFEKFLAE